MLSRVAFALTLILLSGGTAGAQDVMGKRVEQLLTETLAAFASCAKPLDTDYEMGFERSTLEVLTYAGSGRRFDMVAEQSVGWVDPESGATFATINSWRETADLSSLAGAIAQDEVVIIQCLGANDCLEVQLESTCTYRQGECNPEPTTERYRQATTTLNLCDAEAAENSAAVVNELIELANR